MIVGYVRIHEFGLISKFLFQHRCEFGEIGSFDVVSGGWSDGLSSLGADGGFNGV